MNDEEKQEARKQGRAEEPHNNLPLQFKIHGEQGIYIASAANFFFWKTTIFF
ncbi:MAG: hypothetical protein NT166_28325 [Candidatus Aminicenantes bacterium]|nr:hypothetical protein [Candidatus Aminicenantes bacterium]